MKRAVCLGSIMLASTLFLTGCNGGSSAAAAAAGSTATAPPTGPTPAQQLAQLENEGKLPKLDRSDSVAGPDSDGNGVRDDIDAYLRQRFPDAPQRAAATQAAKALQSAVLTAGNDPEASRNVSKKLSDSMHCLFLRFDGLEAPNSPGAVANELEAITSNTKARLLAYLAYNKSRDGTTSTGPTGDTCEE